MKTKILMMVLLFSSVLGFGQWTRQNQVVRLTNRGDAVGVGQVVPTSSKFHITATTSQGVLRLQGYGTQTLPYLSVYSSTLVNLWNLYAGSTWWSFGTSDSTTAPMYVKPATNYKRFNGSTYFNGYGNFNGNVMAFGVKFTDSITPATTGTGYVGTLTHKVGTAYINIVNSAAIS